MLKLHLRAGEEQASWRWRAGRWQVGSGWVQPYAHPALEARCFADGARTLLVVRERGPGGATAPSTVTALDPTAYDEVRAGIAGWPLEHLSLETGPDGVTLTAGRWGSAPVYLASHRGALLGSWDLPDLRPAMSAATLDPAAVARRLHRAEPYSARTLFHGVHQLTERSRAHFSAGRLSLRHPEPVPAHAPRELGTGADPVRAYADILAAAVARGPATGAGTLVEVSGGLDSATVLLGAAEAFGADQLTAAGMLVPGPAGAQQRDRRRALLAGAGVRRDRTVDALTALPFGPGSRRAGGTASAGGTAGAGFSPDGEPYEELTGRMLAAAGGARTVLTGIGGDELMYVPPAGPPSQQPPAPADPGDVRTPLAAELAADPGEPAPWAPVAHSALQAAACRAPTFLRAGSWAVNPLCAPELVTFCQWLPAAWRTGKRLPRVRLARLGYDRAVTHPELPENFAEVMRLGLRQHALGLLADQLATSVLVGLGLVDPGAVLRLADGAAPVPHTLYEVAALDLGLRSLLG
jgi:asparagine synthase (glutamine-hydrolysing)